MFMKFLFITAALYALASCARAQQSPILSKEVVLQLENTGMAALAAQLRVQTGTILFYRQDAVDSIRVSYRGRGTVSQVLDSVCRPAGLYYTVFGDGIYLTRVAPLSLSLGAPQPSYKYISPLSMAAGGRKKRTINANAGEPEARQELSVVIDLDANRVFEIGAGAMSPGKRVTLNGYIRHKSTGEGIGNVSITLDSSQVRTASDKSGYYTITLTNGKHVLSIRCVGMADTRRQIVIRGDGQLNIAMHDYVTSLRAVTIAGEKSSNVRSTSMGVQRVDIKTIKQVPALMGEADILRVLQMLPGVTSAGEGSTGLNVRGGNVDQNLVLLDGATIYNPSHFFGFFSGFNPDLVKDAELYKSSIPVRYGSRLSSVLEVLTREGNRNRLSGSGGIGPLSGHLSLEGPIGKKTSFLAGGRSTYSDWILQLLPEDQYKRSKAGFWDANIRITSEPDDRNSLYLSAYMSGDKFRLDGDTLYHYGNRNIVGKWKHIFNNRLYGTLAAGLDNYNFDMSSTLNKVNAFKFKFDVSQLHLNTDFVYSPDNKNRIEAGISALYYKLHPGSLNPVDSGLSIKNVLPAEQAVESAVYFSDQYTVSPDFTIEAGLRYSMFNYLGARSVYGYQPGAEREQGTITDTTNYGAGRIIKTYHGPEPRISGRYSLSGNSSIKAAYNRTRQYIHMLSNTTVVTPTDIWKLSDPYTRPEVADQVSLGYYRNFKSNVIETSVEVYYKWIQHALSYKSGATLLLNHHIETDIANADGKAYGIELLVKKTAGKLNGWLSYTYSRTFLRMHDPLVIEPINGGTYYPADYDKPHVANLVANYRFSHRFSVSLTTLYSTGRPITLPVARYYMVGSYRVFYDERNQYRIPSYFRTDLSMNIEGNHKIHKLAHSSWTIGVYNLTARRNPYSVYFVSEGGQVNGYKLSIFGTAIPFVTYNFKF